MRVVDLFLKDSVDDSIYAVLRRRCGLFEHFVGAVQSVLARARRMLMGHEAQDLKALNAAADEVQQDLLAHEAYVESEALATPVSAPPATRSDTWDALQLLTRELGYNVMMAPSVAVATVSGPGLSKSVQVAATVETLERERQAVPLAVMDPQLHAVVDALARPDERLPLVIGSAQRGAFRASVAYWIEGNSSVPVERYSELQERINAWDGAYPDAAAWRETEKRAREELEPAVNEAEQRADAEVPTALQRQRNAARTHLLCELGRFLVCLEACTVDLNSLFYR